MTSVTRQGSVVFDLVYVTRGTDLARPAIDASHCFSMTLRALEVCEAQRVVPFRPITMA